MQIVVCILDTTYLGGTTSAAQNDITFEEFGSEAFSDIMKFAGRNARLASHRKYTQHIDIGPISPW